MAHADDLGVQPPTLSDGFSTRQPSALLRSTLVALVGGALTLAVVLVPDQILDRQAAGRFSAAATAAAAPVLDTAAGQFTQLGQLAAASDGGAANTAFASTLASERWKHDALFGDVAFVEYLDRDSVLGSGIEAVMNGDTTGVAAGAATDPFRMVRTFSPDGSTNMQISSDAGELLADIGIGSIPTANAQARLVWGPAATMIRAGIVPPASSAAPAEQPTTEQATAEQAAPEPATPEPTTPEPAGPVAADPVVVDEADSFVQPAESAAQTATTPAGPAANATTASMDAATSSTGRTVIAVALPVTGRGWIVATVVPVDDATNGLARIVEIGDDNAKKTIGGVGIEQTSRRSRTEQFNRTFGPLHVDVAVLGPWRYGTPTRTHPLRNGLAVGGLTLALATALGFRRHRANMRTLTDIVTQARHQARTDALTGLANRVGMLDALDHATADQGVAVLLADLDRFKNVNDSRGHASGDLLLQAVADRFRALADEHPAVRSIARFGGDEFVVVLAGEPDTVSGDAVAFADAILTQLKTPFPLGGDTVVIGASIGLALGAGGDVSSLVSDADIAMYAAKRAGGSRVAVADDELRRAGSGQLDLEIGIRNALATGEFVPYFQPIVDPEGHLHSFEALIRWRRSTGELVSPGAFLPAAQAAGLLAEVSTSVLASVCPYVAAWNTERVQRGVAPLTVHVNCVEGQLMDFGFPDVVSALLTHHGVDPSWIMLEVSEETALDKIARGTPTLQSLRAMGVRFSLDDFGFGNSSLTMLRELGEVAELKLDKSIVDDIATAGIGGDADVVDAILGFAHKRGITIVAEGIEQHEQWTALKGLGVQLYQGFLFSRPLPPEDAALWAAGQRQADVLWRPDADTDADQAALV